MLLGKGLYYRYLVIIAGVLFILIGLKTTPRDLEESRPKTHILKILLLSSNPRSGSTFLGQILANSAAAQNPKVSYWFEPLRWLEESPYLNQFQIEQA